MAGADRHGGAAEYYGDGRTDARGTRVVWSSGLFQLQSQY
jgi:hypothetical protein